MLYQVYVVLASVLYIVDNSAEQFRAEHWSQYLSGGAFPRHYASFRASTLTTAAYLGESALAVAVAVALIIADVVELRPAPPPPPPPFLFVVLRLPPATTAAVDCDWWWW